MLKTNTTSKSLIWWDFQTQNTIKTWIKPLMICRSKMIKHSISLERRHNKHLHSLREMRTRSASELRLAHLRRTENWTILWTKPKPPESSLRSWEPELRYLSNTKLRGLPMSQTNHKQYGLSASTPTVRHAQSQAKMKSSWKHLRWLVCSTSRHRSHLRRAATCERNWSRPRMSFLSTACRSLSIWTWAWLMIKTSTSSSNSIEPGREWLKRTRMVL